MPLYFSQFNPGEALANIAKRENAIGLQNLQQQAQEEQIKQNQLNAQLAQALQPLKMQQAQIDLSGALQKQKEDAELAPLRLQQLRNALDPQYQLKQKEEELKLSQKYSAPSPLNLDIQGTPTSGMLIRDINSPNGFRWQPIDVSQFVNPQGLEQPPLSITPKSSEPAPAPSVLPQNPTPSDEMGQSAQNLGGATLPIPPQIVPRVEQKPIYAGPAFKPSSTGTQKYLTPKDIIDQNVQAILEGRLTMFDVRQNVGRSDAGRKAIDDTRSAILKIDPTFDFVASDSGGKAASSQFFQKSMAAVNSVLPNIDKFVALSNQVPRGDWKGLNSLIQKGDLQFGDKKVSNFLEAQKLISDEIGIALGAGNVSDMKLQLGYDVTDPTVSPDVFASNMEIVKEFINNRKSGLNQLRYSSPAVTATFSGSETLPNSAAPSSVKSTSGTTSDGIKFDLIKP